MSAYWLLLVVYILILLKPFFYHKIDNWFTVDRIYCLLSAYTTLPSLLLAGFTPGAPNLLFMASGAYILNLKWFMVNQSLFNIVFLLTYNKISFKNVIGTKFFYVDYSAGTYRSIAFLLLGGVSMYSAYRFLSIGGLGNWMALLSENAEFNADDAQITLTIVNFLIYLGGVMHMMYMSMKRNFSAFWIIVNLLIAFFTLSFYGGRSPFILYLFNLGIAYNYFYKRLDLLSVKLIPLYVFVLFFIVSMLSLRLGGGLTMDSMTTLSDAAVGGNSYVDIQVSIIDYFKNHDFWYGKPFENFYQIFIPRSILGSDKLPTDDGIFIFNAFLRVNDVFKAECINSWPPSSLGSSYANFGYLGIIFGAVLLALFLRYTYTLFEKSNKSVFMVYVFAFMTVKFQITRFYFANLVYLLFLIIFFASFLKILFLSRKRVI